MRPETTMSHLRILSELEINENTSKSLRSMYYTTTADLYTRQKRYTEAIDPLVTALELISGKRTRYRLTFLLAQLYAKTDNGFWQLKITRKL